VVSAIANQTQILKSCIDRVKMGELVDGEDLQCSYALKWVVHFLGDIAQPLHASGRAAGGNGIEVVFDNHRTTCCKSYHLDSLQTFLDAKHVGMGWLHRLRRRKRHQLPQHNHPTLFPKPHLSHPKERFRNPYFRVGFLQQSF
jgi:hypothetical protein